MSAVFADTPFFIAYSGVSDLNHHAATEYFDNFRGKFHTTECVFWELANFYSRSRMRRRVVAFVRYLKIDDRFQIAACDEQLVSRGYDLYDRRPDKQWSLTDCISFVLMSDLGIRDALTGDHHFEQAGFTALLK